MFDKRQLSRLDAPIFQTRSTVRFQHVDAAGVVFFARFFEYVHEAYEGFLASIGTPLSRVLREQSWAAPLSHAEADYFRPLRLGDELDVQLVAAFVQGSKLGLGFRLVTRDQVGTEQVVAVAQSTHTFIRMDDFEHTAIPDTILSAVAPILGRALS